MHLLYLVFEEKDTSSTEAGLCHLSILVKDGYSVVSCIVIP